MTEPRDDDARTRLAERLFDLTYRGRSMTGPEASAYAKFLLPVVEAIAAERAAEALDELASEMDGVVRLCRIPLWETAVKVRERAAALRAASRGETER